MLLGRNEQQEMNANEPVKLRKRKTRTGLYSLYLDTYSNGKRTYEYLRLYLVPEKTREDKRKNKETIQLAETIRAKRVVEYHNGQYGFDKKEQDKVLLFEYFDSLCRDKMRLNKRSGICWLYSLKHLERYETRGDITFAEVTSDWVAGYKRYLESQEDIAQNSRSLYFSKLRACINQAYRDGIIADNPLRRVGSIKQEESKREYLTIEEVQRLVDTECDSAITKRVFLFACLTGLRWSDIKELRWGDVHKEDYTRITFRQRKTGGQEYLDITHEARELMGEEQGAEELIFSKLPHPSNANNFIKVWTARAGIRKHITFHSARHTFATMMLTLGTDLYTVSKLLGHRDIKTTEIYAKIVDKGKQEAVARIPSILGKEE